MIKKYETIWNCKDKPKDIEKQLLKTKAKINLFMTRQNCFLLTHNHKKKIEALSMLQAKKNLFMKFKYQQNDESFPTIDSKYKLCEAIKCDQNVEGSSTQQIVSFPLRF